MSLASPFLMGVGFLGVWIPPPPSPSIDRTPVRRTKNCFRANLSSPGSVYPACMFSPKMGLVGVVLTNQRSSPGGWSTVYFSAIWLNQFLSKKKRKKKHRGTICPFLAVAPIHKSRGPQHTNQLSASDGQRRPWSPLHSPDRNTTRQSYRRGHHGCPVFRVAPAY